MKRYEFKIIIHEGNDEFWEELESKTGCDEVKEMIKDCLAQEGLDDDNCEIKLIQYNEGE